MGTIKKNIFPILVLLIALAIIAYFLLGEKSLDGVRQDLKPAETTISDNTDSENLGVVTKVCYLKKTPSAMDTTLSNIEYVEVNYAQNAIVTGYMSYIPVGADAQMGEFIGAQDAKLINAIYTGRGGGQTRQEQIIFQVSETGVVQANSAEKITNEEGIRVYTNISKITFSEENNIPVVDCATVNKKEVGIE